jgi:hypothetical protein
MRIGLRLRGGYLALYVFKGCDILLVIVSMAVAYGFLVDAQSVGTVVGDQLRFQTRD